MITRETLVTYMAMGMLKYIYMYICVHILFKIISIHKNSLSSSSFYSWKILRNNCIWRHFRDYFPIELVKTVDLSPDRNYILASFPHGIIG